MSEIIVFRPADGQRRRRTIEGETGGQILLFTGVRYERLDERDTGFDTLAGGTAQMRPLTQEEVEIALDLALS